MSHQFATILRNLLLSSVALACLARQAAGQAPANDFFAAAQPVAGVTGSVTGINLGATIEADEPLSTAGYFSAASLWYDWIAPANGTYVFSLAADFDSQLAVYGGFHVGSLTSHGESDLIGHGGESVTVQASVNTLYRIRISGYQGQVGSFQLAWVGSIHPGMEKVHSFSGEFAASPRIRGSYPNKLVEGSDGVFYGTTYRTGETGGGTYFKMSPAGEIETLKVFPEGDSNGNVRSALVEGPDGMFYGIAQGAGYWPTSDYGAIIRLDKQGNVTTMHSFDGSGLDFTSNSAWQTAAFATQVSEFSFDLVVEALTGPVDGQFGLSSGLPGATNPSCILRLNPAGYFDAVNGSNGYQSVNPVAYQVGKEQQVRFTVNPTLKTYSIEVDGVKVAENYVFQGSAGVLDTVAIRHSSGSFAVKDLTLIRGGHFPATALAFDSDGRLYGTTTSGGFHDCGTVFRYTPGGAFESLADFSGRNWPNPGQRPQTTLVRGQDGKFYGTTSYGGAYGAGTIYRMLPSGSMTILDHFDYWNDGGYPEGDIVVDDDGSIYGTTRLGGAFGYGTIYKLTPQGTIVALVSFTGNAGANPGREALGGLVRSNDGFLYGTTEQGGTNGQGTIFKVSRSGVHSVLASCDSGSASANGAYPVAGLLKARNGTIYGSTDGGGSDRFGTVFKLGADGEVIQLAEFSGNGGGSLGGSPSELVEADDGYFYGTTLYGGRNLFGTIFRMSKSGSVSTMAEFTGEHGTAQGAYPFSGLTKGTDGKLYGTTSMTTIFYTWFDSGGTAYKYTPGGGIDLLADFPSNQSSSIGSGLFMGLEKGADGNFYGMNSWGGAHGNGVVFKLEPNGTRTILMHLSDIGFSGGATQGGITLAADGSFYGTGVYATGGFGAIFRLQTDGTPAGTSMTILHAFPGVSPDGKTPVGRLLDYGNGVFYGVTSEGGVANQGTIFKVVTNGTPQGTTVTTLLGFTGNGSVNRGAHPNGGLVKGPDGNIYGTTRAGGASDLGTVFRMSPNGVLTTIAEITDPLDAYPSGGLILASDGNIYGTTSGEFDFGRNYSGSVYRLLFPGPPILYEASANNDGTSDVKVAFRFNPRGLSTRLVLEYGLSESDLAATMLINDSIAGYQTLPVTSHLHGLAPGTTYFYRIRATSALGTTLSPIRSFATLAPPSVSIAPATDILANSATFHGVVNARNLDTNVLFEWGTDGNTFPNSLPASPPSVTGVAHVAVNMPVAGLLRGATYHFRIVATSFGGTTVSGTQSFTTLTDPVASLAAPTAVTFHSARLNGVVNARGAPASVTFEYGTDGIVFPSSIGATPPQVDGSEPVAVHANLAGLTQGVTYYYRIRAASAGGIGYSSVAPLALDILSGFTQTFPTAPPEAQGFVLVTLFPPGVGGWRFAGEQQWRASGVPVGGLATGDRTIEFRPVPGYLQPPPETVAVISGGAATFLDRTYYDTPATGSGGLSVLLKPDDIAAPALPESQRARWRLLGEDDTRWRDSEAVLSGLVPGNYLVECRPVAGRATPPPASVLVQDNQTAVATVTYFLADSPTGTAPSVLPFETVSTDTSLPHAWVGQIRSDAGSSSGFVVKSRVVATAGHVVFDDATLAPATGLQWLFQRDRATFEPKPQIPRGFYLFDSYSAQRAAENSPGTSSPLSQTLDAAALYFLEDAGRGGFGGYLASDADNNEFLLSTALKTLVGYPVDGIPALLQGRMHATAPANATFTRAYGRTFTTSTLRGVGGMSGGPLCVQFEGGAYYPAAIYLGGSGQTVVRGIDSQVIELFDRAETSGNGGSNNTGGGITHTSVTGTLNTSLRGSLKVLIEPQSAVDAQARWTISPESQQRISNTTKTGLTPGTYVLLFSAVPGFQVAAPQQVAVTGGQTTTVTFTYAANLSPIELWRQIHFGSSSNSGSAADTADPDRDGRSNIDEFAANTDPNNPADLLKILSTIKSPAAFTLTAQGKIGRAYALQRKTELAASSWSTISSQGPLVADATLVLTDPAPPPSAAFYRIVVWLP